VAAKARLPVRSAATPTTSDVASLARDDLEAALRKDLEFLCKSGGARDDRLWRSPRLRAWAQAVLGKEGARAGAPRELLRLVQRHQHGELADAADALYAALDSLSVPEGSTVKTRWAIWQGQGYTASLPKFRSLRREAIVVVAREIADVLVGTRAVLASPGHRVVKAAYAYYLDARGVASGMNVEISVVALDTPIETLTVTHWYRADLKPGVVTFEDEWGCTLEPVGPPAVDGVERRVCRFDPPIGSEPVEFGYRIKITSAKRMLADLWHEARSIHDELSLTFHFREPALPVDPYLYGPVFPADGPPGFDPNKTLPVDGRGKMIARIPNLIPPWTYGVAWTWPDGLDGASESA
jgi:hypothetical protein